MFAANGAALASWVVRIPDVRAELGLRDTTLGLALAAASVGVVSALPLAGGIIPRVGSRRVVLVGVTVVGITLATLAIAPGPLALAGLLLVFGAGLSTMDVGMNAHGVAVEGGYGRSILVGFHAAWSLGSLVAAGVGALAVAARVPLGVHFGIVAATVVVATLLALPWLRVVDRVTADERTRRRRGPALALPHGAIVPIAIVSLGAALGESAVTDWSGIFLRDAVEVAPGQVGWGFVAFTAAMTVTRLLGDRVADRIGRARTVALGAWVATGGFVLAVAIPSVPTALIGFFAVGVGVAVTIPLSFAAAGGVTDSPGEGIAGVAAVSYAGFLVAPPVLGAIADRASIRVSLLLVAVAMLILAGRPDAFPEPPVDTEP